MDALIAVNLITLVTLLLSLSITLSERRRLKKIIDNLRKIEDSFESAIKDNEDHVRVVEDSFLEIEESILSELSDSINNLKAGRYEEVYNILTSLADTVTTDITYSKEAKSEESAIKKN